MMKTKIFGFILMLGMAAVLGACEPAPQPDATPEAPPAPGEPSDGAATPDPAPESTP
ncbi:hypothetical protein VB620_10580 [Nodularia harveyana UHCC-0300]|uniref:Uncharacterized protein n=1 Tax=Nodularia harveyana UHCC-0300 TaxID=2974287 RepID=A0ABU5UFM0_9CYAN|nr:hypothetical protein [Nodularia harveyana]MEA5581781.1 hypothetical protein [Nodularia harveyana UHCC-0300]